MEKASSPNPVSGCFDRTLDFLVTDFPGTAVCGCGFLDLTPPTRVPVDDAISSSSGSSNSGCTVRWTWPAPAGAKPKQRQELSNNVHNIQDTQPHTIQLHYAIIIRAYSCIDLLLGDTKMHIIHVHMHSIDRYYFPCAYLHVYTYLLLDK